MVNFLKIANGAQAAEVSSLSFAVVGAALEGQQDPWRQGKPPPQGGTEGPGWLSTETQLGLRMSPGRAVGSPGRFSSRDPPRPCWPKPTSVSLLARLPLNAGGGVSGP